MLFVFLYYFNALDLSLTRSQLDDKVVKKLNGMQILAGISTKDVLPLAIEVKAKALEPFLLLKCRIRLFSYLALPKAKLTILRVKKKLL